MSSAAALAHQPKRPAAVPFALITLRVLLTPLVLLLAYKNIRGLPIALCVFPALVSDYFDHQHRYHHRMIVWRFQSCERAAP